MIREKRGRGEEGEKLMEEIGRKIMFIQFIKSLTITLHKPTYIRFKLI